MHNIRLTQDIPLLLCPIPYYLYTVESLQKSADNLGVPAGTPDLSVRVSIDGAEFP